MKLPRKAKVPAHLRVVHIAEPLSQLLREYVANKRGYLFAVKSGRPLQQRNVLRALHSTGNSVGLRAWVDSEPTHCIGRVSRRTSQNSGLPTQKNP